MSVRPCRDNEREDVLAIINSAAEAYRGVIPADSWHEPYMPAHELDHEIAAGVSALLKSYWTIPDRQVETSVVLANPPFPASQ